MCPFSKLFYFEYITGQGQTCADLQGMCDRMSGVSREVYTSDQVLNSHKEAKSQQDTNKNGFPGDPSGLSDIDMLSETSFTSLMKADNSIVKVKEERDIEHIESSIAEGIVDVDEVTDTASESEETDTASESDGLGSISQILRGITDMNASQVEGNSERALAS